MEARDWERAAALLHDDFVAEWPLSREVIRGRERFIARNQAYPGEWHITVLQVVDGGDHVATEVRVEIGNAIEYALSFFELRNGLIAREVGWWPEGFYDAPLWRAGWTERLDELP
jgi:hypothetical protein